MDPRFVPLAADTDAVDHEGRQIAHSENTFVFPAELCSATGKPWIPSSNGSSPAQPT